MYILDKAGLQHFWSKIKEKFITNSSNDIPKVFINGTIPADKTDVQAELTYVSANKTFESYITIKCQGTSSMSYPKKNFTIKLFSDSERSVKLNKSFKSWGEQNKFCLKANYIDHSHARNIISANLWSEVVSSRSDYNNLPEQLRNSPNNGGIDGFPIKVYNNGIYQGIYTWNIPKEDWLFNMDKNNTNHILLCAETNTDGVYAETPCNFRSLWDGVDGNDWSVEVGTNSDELKNSLNNLIICVKDTDDETFKSTIGNYLDIQSAIDYYIHQYVICGLDGLAKNMLLATYDGIQWYCGAYDMDSTFGLYWDGQSFVSSTYKCPDQYQEQYSLLWERMAELYSEEIKERYFELRTSVYTVANMFTKFERFTELIGKDLYEEDISVYNTIPSSTTNNITQIRNYIVGRLKYIDSIFNGTGEETEDINLYDASTEPTMNWYIEDTRIGEYSTDYSSYMKIEPSTTYQITKTPGQRFRVGTTINVPEPSYNLLQYTENDTGDSITITTNATVNYLIIYFADTSLESLTVDELKKSITVKKV